MGADGRLWDLHSQSRYGKKLSIHLLFSLISNFSVYSTVHTSSNLPLLLQRTAWRNSRVSPVTSPPGTCCALCPKQRKSAGTDSSTMPRPLSSSRVATWMKGRADKSTRNLLCTCLDVNLSECLLLPSSPSALEHFKRWLVPEKVAISAEELQYLLRPTQTQEAAEPSQTQIDQDTVGDRHTSEEDDTHSPEK